MPNPEGCKAGYYAQARVRTFKGMVNHINTLIPELHDSEASKFLHLASANANLQMVSIQISSRFMETFQVILATRSIRNDVEASSTPQPP
eukprot:scaffold326836_cov39-Prasinocladus_malaysianus.AAC.1